MLRSLKLIFLSDKEWEKMSLNPPHPAVVFFVSLFPLILAMFAIEAWGLNHFGETHGELGTRMRLPQERIIKYVIFYGLAAISVILLGAALLRNVAPSFNLYSTFGTCFTLMAYGYSPILLLRGLDAFPQIETWICWIIGAMLSLRVLYHGVAHWLKPEQTKGLGVFLISVIYLVVLGGLVHFASIQVLHGKFLQESDLQMPGTLAP
jgi:hypothetical protein